MSLSDRPDQSCACRDTTIWSVPHSNDVGVFHDRIFVTDMGAIGIEVGGTVYVKTLKAWHELAGGAYKGPPLA